MAVKRGWVLTLTAGEHLERELWWWVKKLKDDICFMFLSPSPIKSPQKVNRNTHKPTVCTFSLVKLNSKWFCVLIACWPHLCFAIHGCDMWQDPDCLLVSHSAEILMESIMNQAIFQMTYIFFNQLIFLWIPSCNLSISGVTQCWKPIYRRKLFPCIVTSWQCQESHIPGMMSWSQRTRSMWATITSNTIEFLG